MAHIRTCRWANDPSSALPSPRVARLIDLVILLAPSIAAAALIPSSALDCASVRSDAGARSLGSDPGARAGCSRSLVHSSIVDRNAWLWEPGATGGCATGRGVWLCVLASLEV